ncbi:Regucalcin [Pseudolycoriella hygida]|uniref:Regucalcin n=1 Tax=Pseudolycoriella hygida TaxID=35572 RepID=A0A9Q0RZL6_9DIPT|nr:Regucalcin [Pseudolycoriella hygida]
MKLCLQIIRIPVYDGLKIGSSSIWDEKAQSVYFVDFFNPNATICRYDYKENEVFCATIFNQPSASSIAPIKGSKNELVVGIKHSIKVVVWNGRDASTSVTRTIFNVEAHTDPTGRIYVESFTNKICGAESANSSLYTFTKKSGVNQVATGFRANGVLAWNKKMEKFYHMNACDLRIYEYDWDKKTGNLNNQRNVFDFDANEVMDFYPSGLTIDREGFLYTALYEGSMIYKIDPKTRSTVSRIKMPITTPSHPTFGGPELDELFVVSGTVASNFQTGGLKEKQPMNEMSGSLFKIVGLGTKGYASARPSF